MDWERVLINLGVVLGFFALMSFWIGLAMWMRVDADKRGMLGWPWIYVGLLTGPLGLIGYIIFRGNRPVLPIVLQRDEIIAENMRTHTAIDYNPDAPPDSPVLPSQELSPPPDPIQAALEAEERGYRTR